jgi:hypothetical protein
MSELKMMLERLETACCPEDVFGGADVATSYRKLARACHPDLHRDPLAARVFQRLAEFKAVAEERQRDGLWGRRIPLPHCAPLVLGAYTVRRAAVHGDVADVYTTADDALVVKVARDAGDNDLMRAEASALETLKEIPTLVVEGVPRLDGSFAVDGSWKRQAHALTAFPGFVTAEQIREAMTVDARTAVWMMKRVLALLSWAHHFGLVHGAILPPHVLFYPDNDGSGKRDARKHSVRVIDWCYSVDRKTRTRLSAWVPAWKEQYAPELLDKSYLGPESDLYMTAALIRYLAGGLPARLEAVIERCLDHDPKKRYPKAEHAMEAWSAAARAEFGSPRWHEFNLPR